MKICGTCKYLVSLERTGRGLICIKSENKASADEFMSISDLNYLCVYYTKNNPKDRFEWDPVKNETNKVKHFIEFERAIDVFMDPNKIQIPMEPSRWEEIDDEVFTIKGIEKNEGNMDPVRGQIIGMIDGKVFTYIYTFRNDLDDLTCRVISLRRASKEEEKIYESFKQNK